MKQIIILSLLSLLFPFSGSAKQVKTCRLDKRPFTERKADYLKIIEYPSGLSESNTRYSPDLIEYNEKLLKIDYSPLCDFKKISEALVRDNAPFAKKMRADKPPFQLRDAIRVFEASFPLFKKKRDFLATWVIRDDRLFLKDIRLTTPDIYWYSALENPKESDYKIPIQIDPPKKEVMQRLQKAIGRKFDNEQLIFADWFSGELIGETYEGKTDDCRGEQAVLIQIKKGKVESIQFKKLEPIIESHKGVVVRALNQDPYLFFEEARKTWGRE